MSTVLLPSPASLTLPDHTHLPDRDGTFSRNDQEHPQSMLLTGTILPVLRLLRPDNQFCIGQDLGIYWRLAAPPAPLYNGAVAADWFLALGVPRILGGLMRRSYVMWQELVAPTIVLEFVSGTGQEERDQTPLTGKFWIYEQGIRIPYYGIYEVDPGRVELYRLVGGRYEIVSPNSRGHFEIPSLDLELGIWFGRYQAVELPWLRWWDPKGILLPTPDELLEHGWARTGPEKQRAEQEKQRAERLAAQLRALGVEPEA